MRRIKAKGKREGRGRRFEGARRAHGPHGRRRGQSPGLPGFNVPMGFTHGNLPAGLQIVGRLFGEPELIKIA